ncbi:hypothetical protein GC250_05105 [Sulfolobus metallicus DSM 6482 = JCM 9184]|uniref:Uncharacterized protein n=2 Tax=Sulfuracidifex metallicus TaxID=47303 RepID=A0A6A9QHU9_SULME|nr:hypothetical protein [Sulfuracidifex metallicus DSM 6482 = JCM 9184]
MIRKMRSLSILSNYPQLKNAVMLAEKVSKEMDLEPVIMPQLDDNILNNIVKDMEYRYSDIFNEYKYTKDLFVRKVLEKEGKGEKKSSLTNFPYYVVPFSSKTVVRMIGEDQIPAHGVILNGTVRLSFLPYESYSTLEQRINSKEEDDVVVTFKDEKITNFERKRSIFIEPNLVTKILSSKGAIEGSLWTSVETLLIFPMINMNVYDDNVVEIIMEDEISFKIEKGKATRDDVNIGNTVDLEEKAKIYYDHKTKKNLQKEIIIKALISKLP